MQDLLNFYNSIPADTWIALFGAGGVSVVTQLGKNLLKLENERVVQIFFVTVAVAASGLQYIMSAHNLPPTILGLHTAVLVGIGSQWYSHIIKPTSTAISNYKQLVAKTNQQQPIMGVSGATTAQDTNSTSNTEFTL